MINKYDMLNNAIEAICNSAPDTFGRYRMEGKSEEEKNNIRAKGYIHLFLLIKFGLQDFKTRHDYITDGPGDGGVDAYYIDTNRRVIYLIQSKYRIDEGNYENKEISSAEIASMELKSILDGKLNGEDGRPYNGKIRGMQKKISGLPNLGLYDYKIILLANLYKSESLKVVKTIFSGLSYDVFDYTRAYDELVFPYCTSTYFQGDSIIIDRNIMGVEQCCKESFENTSYGKCSVALLFVPLSFVAEIVDEYKNSILQYNPRNYLSMSKNPVNKAISVSLKEQNENFALLNNGITMICSDFICSTQNGLNGSTNIRIEDPQIINGGQTGFTLSRIYRDDPEKLQGKKVLLKIIATYKSSKEQQAVTDEEKQELSTAYATFVNSISDATNMQTKIDEADRKANLQAQISMQKRLFAYYGLLYERKQGEYEEALHQKIFDKDQVIKRDTFVKCLWAMKGDCAKAMSISKADLFDEDALLQVINENTDAKCAVFSYLFFSLSVAIDNKNKKQEHPVWGNGTRYGKYALLSVAGRLVSTHLEKRTGLADILELAERSLEIILNEWGEFEKYVRTLQTNETYFKNEVNYFNYYKSQNVQNDINVFWSNYEMEESAELCLVKKTGH